MVKILEQPENQKSAMMDGSDEGQSVGSSLAYVTYRKIGSCNTTLLGHPEAVGMERRKNGPNGGHWEYTGRWPRRQNGNPG
jgi:hypothetical protein